MSAGGCSTFTVPAAIATVRFAGTRRAAESTYFFGVLHTWGRNLSYHPHIHHIVPAGAFDSRTHRWHDCPTAFYAPVRILSKLVKERFYDLIQDTGLLEELPRGAFEKDWNVDSRPVGSGVRALRYLSAYVFRTAISEKRMSLKPFEFMRRFLQHVLPKGFMKIRYFGFLHPSSAIPLRLAVALLEAAKDVYVAGSSHTSGVQTWRSLLPPLFRLWRCALKARAQRVEQHHRRLPARPFRPSFATHCPIIKTASSARAS